MSENNGKKGGGGANKTKDIGKDLENREYNLRACWAVESQWKEISILTLKSSF